MRKWFILGSLFVLTIILAACGKSNGEKEDKEITIAASPAPHGVVLEHARNEKERL